MVSQGNQPIPFERQRGFGEGRRARDQLTRKWTTGWLRATVLRFSWTSGFGANSVTNQTKNLLLLII